MTDIVERLRDEGHLQQRDGFPALLQTAADARDEIERLRARIAELEALVKLAQRLIDPCYPESHGDWQSYARAALGEKNNG